MGTKRSRDAYYEAPPPYSATATPSAKRQTRQTTRNKPHETDPVVVVFSDSNEDSDASLRCAPHRRAANRPAQPLERLAEPDAGFRLVLSNSTMADCTRRIQATLAQLFPYHAKSTVHPDLLRISERERSPVLSAAKKIKTACRPPSRYDKIIFFVGDQDAVMLLELAITTISPTLEYIPTLYLTSKPGHAEEQWLRIRDFCLDLRQELVKQGTISQTNAEIDLVKTVRVKCDGCENSRISSIVHTFESVACVLTGNALATERVGLHCPAWHQATEMLVNLDLPTIGAAPSVRTHIHECFEKLGEYSVESLKALEAYIDLGVKLGHQYERETFIVKQLLAKSFAMAEDEIAAVRKTLDQIYDRAVTRRSDRSMYNQNADTTKCDHELDAESLLEVNGLIKCLANTICIWRNLDTLQIDYDRVVRSDMSLVKQWDQARRREVQVELDQQQKRIELMRERLHN